MTLLKGFCWKTQSGSVQKTWAHGAKGAGVYHENTVTAAQYRSVQKQGEWRQEEGVGLGCEYSQGSERF